MINSDPLTYRWKRTTNEAFGCDAASASAIKEYKIRPRWSSMIVNAGSMVYIVVCVALVVFK